MFSSSHQIDRGGVIKADLVIVGAGAAGITIANHFANKKQRVVVLESGGEQLAADTQSLNAGALIGLPDHPLDFTRLRYFGGTTNHWEGWCRPLEPEDFAERSDWAESGWPISRADLEPYYALARDTCQLGPISFSDEDTFWRRQRGYANFHLLPFKQERLRNAIFQLSAPTRFGTVYGPGLKAAANIEVILDATALELLPAPGHHPDQTTKQIGGILVSGLDGRRFTASGRKYIIATGGIEVPRLLLLSQQIHPNGAGNEHDLVGRYFADHPSIRASCYLRFPAGGVNLPFYFNRAEIGGTRAFATIAANQSLIRKEGLGNFRLALTPSRISTAGNESAHLIVDAIAHGKMPPDLFHNIGNLLADIDVLADNAYKTLTHSTVGFLEGRQSGRYDGAWVDLNFEQRPNRDSRVTLGSERDALGQRRVAVDWRLSDTDRRTATRAFELAGQEFGRLNLGRVHDTLDLSGGKSWPWMMTGSCHHSGTARMSDDPRKGVVDGNGRMHAIENVHIAGSATFPTIGYANPTLTIVAMARRLADHLEKELA